jgi:uncharacterized membrane protein YdfJ with MMPL/SSD domain
MVGALAIALALGGAALVTEVWSLTIVLQSVVSMLGLGLGIDYALLLVSRFREARRSGLGPEEAAVESARTAGHSVIVSAAAVTVGVAALGDFLLVQILGVALAAAVVLDATVVRLAVGPALLAIAGRWNWWPGTPVEQGRAPAPALSSDRDPAASVESAPRHPASASPEASG